MNYSTYFREQFTGRLRIVIRAVLFDIGSTLWSSPAEDPDGLVEVYSRGREALVEAGIIAPPIEMLIDAVEGYLAQWEDIWRTDPGQVMQRPTSEFVADSLVSLNISAPPDVMQKFTDEVMEASVYTAKAESSEEGMSDALTGLADMGLRVACVSNAFMGAATLQRIMDAKGLGEHLEFIISSAETGIRKPDEAIYLAAALQLGLPPEDIAFVGDRLDADVEGPAAVGMRTVLTRQYRDEDPTTARVKPDAVIQHLSELAGAIKKLNGE